MKESLKLLLRRECVEIIGPKGTNFWLLAGVAFVTFLAISFGNASIDFLTQRMADPFTNWVDIDIQQTANRLRPLEDSLSNPAVKKRFGFTNFQYDQNHSLTLLNGKVDRIKVARVVKSLNCRLVKAILNEDNVVWSKFQPKDTISPEYMGMIITEDALSSMEYGSDHGKKQTYPQYLAVEGTLAQERPESIPSTQKIIEAPLPILAVVKHLPGNVDLLYSKYAMENIRKNNGPFVFSDSRYFTNLYYWVPKENSEEVKALISNKGCDVTIIEDPSLLRKLSILSPAQEGVFLFVWCRGLDINSAYRLDQEIQEACQDFDLWRIYDYALRDYEIENVYQFISIDFERLDSIRAFQRYLKENFNDREDGNAIPIDIDIAQVNSKENFSFVSVLAGVLSWAMIGFAIICIILFIVNMLQSYFLKVKRNLGTFKAFGISNRELIGVYVRMLFGLMLAAIILSLILCWVVQLALLLCHAVRQGGAPYLSLWCVKTWICVGIMLIATVVTAFLVMKSLLSHTPGDLIYDR
ncbi:MAG: ABC transporter permease [Bacteroidales bacterium]|nr:ABC transporter permease [Bacteroidales bacterium]